MTGFKLSRIIGGVFKLLLVALIGLIFGLLIWRVWFSTKVPDTVDTLMPNSALHSAYLQYGEELTLRYQEQGTITRGKNNAGYFSVVSCVFIPEAEQVQIVFRYNNGTIDHLAEDYNLEAVPDKSEHLFDVTLVRTTDLTPDDASDNNDASTLAKQRFQPTGSLRDETLLYTYYRYVFDGVTAEDLTDGIFVDVYYNGAINYEATAYGTLCIYSRGEEWKEYKPSRADRDALEQAG